MHYLFNLTLKDYDTYDIKNECINKYKYPVYIVQPTEEQYKKLKHWLDMYHDFAYDQDLMDISINLANEVSKIFNETIKGMFNKNFFISKGYYKDSELENVYKYILFDVPPYAQVYLETALLLNGIYTAYDIERECTYKANGETVNSKYHEEFYFSRYGTPDKAKVITNYRNLLNIK